MRLCCRDKALPGLPHGEGKRRSWRRGSEGTHSISIHGPSAAGSAGDSPGCFLPVLACPTALTAHISSPPSSYCWTGQTCVLPSCDFLFSPADSLKFALLCIPVVKNSALCNPSPNSHDSPRQSDAPSSLVTWRNLFYMGHPVILSSNTLSFFFSPPRLYLREREAPGEGRGEGQTISRPVWTPTRSRSRGPQRSQPEPKTTVDPQVTEPAGSAHPFMHWPTRYLLTTSTARREVQNSFRRTVQACTWPLNHKFVCAQTAPSHLSLNFRVPNAALCPDSAWTSSQSPAGTASWIVLHTQQNYNYASTAPQGRALSQPWPRCPAAGEVLASMKS